MDTIHSPFKNKIKSQRYNIMTNSTLKVFLVSSALLASLVTADTCTDCTAVVSTIAARLMSEESLAAQGVVKGYPIINQGSSF